MNKGLVDDLQKSARRFLAMTVILKEIETDQFQVQLSNDQIVELIHAIYELEPIKKLATTLKQYDPKATLPKVSEGKLTTLLRDSYTHVTHWSGKSLDQYEISSENSDLTSRVLDTLIEAGIVMEQMAPGYIRPIGKKRCVVRIFLE